MLTYRQGDDAHRGGLDLILSLTEDQADALGVHAAELAEALDTVLVGLAALRTGQDPVVPAGPGLSLKDEPISAEMRWDEWLLRDLAALRTAVDGTTAAAIRAHVAHGGSHADLAAATGVSRATAQSRRNAITRNDPSDDELWATTQPTDEGAPAMGKRNVNIASGNDNVTYQVGQVGGGTGKSAKGKGSAGSVESTNIRSGNATVGRQIDTFNGDLNI